MKPLVAALAASLSLAACSSGPVSGVVIAKSYSPPSTTVSTTVVCGKTCNPVVVPIHVPECYAVAVRTEEGEAESRCVSSKTYEAVEVGDEIRLD